MNIKQGFSRLSKKARSAIASLGGIAAHEQGTGHEFTSEEAKAASMKLHEDKNLGTIINDKYSRMDIPAWKKFYLRHPERHRELQREYRARKKAEKERRINGII